MSGNDEVQAGSSTPAGEQQQQPKFVYCCRLCRAALFNDTELVPHAKGGKGFHRGGRNGSQGGGADDDDGQTCTSLFLDPDTTPWVAAESRTVAAETAHMDAQDVALPDMIYCTNPRCGAKIGSQSWTGAQCSCGAWVTPAFKILVKTVDKFPAEMMS